VQWHPERGVEQDPSSQAIFKTFIEAARAKHDELTGEFETI
jgi:gamma-glutamyl-gamma-aminobutyrate hydrolase PuuD